MQAKYGAISRTDEQIRHYDTKQSFTMNEFNKPATCTSTTRRRSHDNNIAEIDGRDGVNGSIERLRSCYGRSDTDLGS